MSVFSWIWARMVRLVRRIRQRWQRPRHDLDRLRNTYSALKRVQDALDSADRSGWCEGALTMRLRVLPVVDQIVEGCREIFEGSFANVVDVLATRKARILDLVWWSTYFNWPEGLWVTVGDRGDVWFGCGRDWDNVWVIPPKDDCVDMETFKYLAVIPCWLISLDKGLDMKVDDTSAAYRERLLAKAQRHETN